MISRFYVDNFKSLVEFELELAKFTCLIGLNGAGKSTVLQALDFSSALMHGKVEEWLEKRGWKAKDLNSLFLNRINIEIEIDLQIESQRYRWQATFNRKLMICTQERIFRLDNDQLIFNLKDSRYQIDDSKPTKIAFSYQGSVLSTLLPELLTTEIKLVKEHISALRSLDLLSPQFLRQKARKAERYDIGMGGEQLSAFVHQLSDHQKKKLLSQLQHYYPQINAIHTKAQRSGWIQLEVSESYNSSLLFTEARHINDGMLRLLAILAQQFSRLEILMFDEIENGINPEVTERIVDALVNSPKQIIVTTHSPMVLNYLVDEVAKESVILLYKRNDGFTRSAHFFALPSPERKLLTLAPGDAMLDVLLNEAALEAEAKQGVGK